MNGTVCGLDPRKDLRHGVAAFLVTSPYVLVHPGQAAHESLRVQRLARKGWLAAGDVLNTWSLSDIKKHFKEQRA